MRTFILTMFWFNSTFGLLKALLVTIKPDRTTLLDGFINIGLGLWAAYLLWG